MIINRRRFVGASGATLAALGLPVGRAGAQGAQPLDTVKLITGFPPGGTSDTLCRRVAENLRGGTYTKSALVENKPGAGGQIAVQSMKGAPTDGSVLLQTPASMLMIYPHIYKNLAYNAFTDVTAVSQACTFDFGFCVGPAVPDSVKNIPEFLAWCKANPDKANYGSPAAGSVPHFIGVLLGQAGGIELKHVPYRGSAPAVQDLVAGQIQAVSAPVGEFTQQANAGKIRFLGVSGAARSRFAPNVPTFAEQGYKDLVFSEWFGFFAPGGTPAPVVERANGALRTALAQKDVIDGLAVMGLEAKSSTPQELATLLKESYDRWGPIVKKIGFTAEFLRRDVVDERWPPYPALASEHVRGARLFANRHDQIAGLPIARGGRVAEIGVWRAAFSKVLVDLLKPSQFVAFDIFTGHLETNWNGMTGHQLFDGLTHRRFYEREMAPFAANVTIVEGDSRQTLRPYADRSFDLVYIDGNHDHEFVKSDAELGAEMVKDAGFLVFNDYMLIDHNHANYGIVPVVNDMVVNHGWQVVGFALDQHLYCDIALQRRTATAPAEPPVITNRPSFMKRLFGS